MLLIAACTPQPPAVVSDNSAAAPAPSGTWSGDYGPGADRREPIRVDLRWEDTNLRGTVHAGARSLDLTKVSFKPETGDISMEFEAQGNNGQTVHYKIEGKVEGDTMSGTWRHERQSGDFRVKRR
jgi:hypothetical protein